MKTLKQFIAECDLGKKKSYTPEYKSAAKIVNNVIDNRDEGKDAIINARKSANKIANAIKNNSFSDYVSNNSIGYTK